MRFRASSTSGAIRAAFEAEYLAGEKAVTRAMRGAAGELKSRWRAQVAAANLGQRLANAIRSEAYPDDSSEASMNAAAMVWTKAPKITGAFESGALIRAYNARWLAIPTPAAGRMAGGKAPTPGEWQFRHGIKLRLVRTRRGTYMLVADGARISRAGLAKKKRGRRRPDGILTGEVTAVIFIMVKQAKLSKRLSLMEAAEQVASMVPGAIVNGWMDA